MSLWDQHQIESKVRAILDVRSHNPDHHFGRPFLTPYQIALEFEERYPAEFSQIGKPVGGRGNGQQDSLAQYLALELSKRISQQRLVGIEGRFLHRAHLRTLQYERDEHVVESSSMQAYDLSMFRLDAE